MTPTHSSLSWCHTWRTPWWTTTPTRNWWTPFKRTCRALPRTPRLRAQSTTSLAYCRRASTSPRMSSRKLLKWCFQTPKRWLRALTYWVKALLCFKGSLSLPTTAVPAIIPPNSQPSNQACWATFRAVIWIIKTGNCKVWSTKVKPETLIITNNKYLNFSKKCNIKKWCHRKAKSAWSFEHA